MEHLERLEPLLAEARVWGEHASALGERALAIELPVPDVAVLAASLLGMVCIFLSQSGRAQDAQAELEDVYRAELLSANRRTQQVQGALRRAHLDIERERQKRRRDAIDARERKARIVPLPKPAERTAAAAR